MVQMDLIATATFGVESLVARELMELGYTEQKVENGKVTFKGDETAICRTNLWLRKAERVQVQIGQFEARTFEELFQQTKALPWSDWLPENANFPVEGKSIKSTLHSVPDCQAIVKKAVVEKMKEKYKTNWFEEDGARYTIQVALLKDIVTLTIDTTGVGLHKRGYRKLVGRAPLKETLASVMISLSRWKSDRTLIDPFCGVGTIPIEAALQGLNIAPGLKRSFIAEDWPIISPKKWEEAREEANQVIQKDKTLDIAGFDIDKEVLSLARYHAKNAGVESNIHFQQGDFLNLKSKKKYGYIICNPPYGERLENEDAVERIYEDMGKVFGELDTWSYYVITSNPRFEALFNRKSNKNRKLYNGRIECHYYQFFGPKPPREKENFD
ncbi:MAG: class I SAM-dependent RNA methyltransferase [Clostridia bacterium]|nr:class I SAM-dependent RNA methyltransferase [Clostridia bacterium]